jgi:hypothetical protein
MVASAQTGLHSLFGNQCEDRWQLKCISTVHISNVHILTVFLNPSLLPDTRLQAEFTLRVSSNRSLNKPIKTPGEDKSTFDMPLAALAIVGGLALGRSATDKRAKKQEDRASRRALSLVPQSHRKDINHQPKEIEQPFGNT